MQNEHIERMIEIEIKLRNEVDPVERRRLGEEHFLLGVDAFNEHIAGTITTATGKKLHTPPIEL